jgi:hypothetical protein
MQVFSLPLYFCCRVSIRGFGTFQLSSGVKSAISQILFFLILAAMMVHSHLKGADFHVFYTAGSRVLNDIPAFLLSDDWMPFKYHPAWAVMFSWLARLPEKFSLFLFNCAQLGCWFGAATIWARRLGYDFRGWPARLLLLLTSLSALSAEIGFGQINGCIFLGITLMFEMLEADEPHPEVAGFILGLLISMKLNLALLAIYAVTKNRRTIPGILMAWVVLHIIVAGFYLEPMALHPYREWLTVLFTQSSEQLAIYESQGLLRFMISLTPLGKAAWLAALLAFCSFGLRAISSEDKSAGGVWVSIYWLSGTFLFSPLAWWYQILYMYPAIFYILKNTKSAWQRSTAVACLLIFALVNFNTVGRVAMQSFKENQGYFACSAVLIALFHLIRWDRRSVVQTIDTTAGERAS